MRRWTRWMAAVLAAVMLVSLLPMASAANLVTGAEKAETAPAVNEEGRELSGQVQMLRPSVRQAEDRVEEEQAQELSLLPLTERSVYPNMRGYTPMELAEVKISDLLAGEIKDADHPYRPLDGTEKVASAPWGDSYTITDMNGVVNLNRDNSYEMIVGSCKQLDDTAIRYYVSASVDSYYNWLTISVYTQDTNGTRTEIQTLDDDYNYHYRYTSDYYVTVPSAVMESGKDLYVGIAINEDFTNWVDKGYTLKAYRGAEGDYEKGTAVDVTAKLLDQDMTKKDAGMIGTGYNYWESVITLELSDGNEIVGSESFYLDLSSAYTGLSRYGLKKDPSDSTSIVYTSTWEWDDRGYETVVYKLYSNYPTNGQYYQRLSFYVEGKSINKNSPGYADLVIVPAYYTSLATAQRDINAGRISNIKDQALSDPGYQADFSAGVIFTAFYQNEAYYLGVKTEDSGRSYSDLSDTAYLHVYGALDGVDGNSYNTYVIDGNDSYYDEYQTVLVLDDDFDLTSVVPQFTTATNATVYAGTPPQAQESGKNTHDFSAGPILYSVSAENGEGQDNAWVTFVKKQDGSSLFVNGINGPDGAKREVFLNSYAGLYHDIFLANVGSATLTGLTASLSSDAANVKLDEYWTVGGDNNDTLAAFDSVTSSSYYGELANVAKVRLVPDGDGTISGKLNLTYDTASGTDTVTIDLTGEAGDPRILTTEIPVGVKYVPYGTMIQHTNVYDWNRVTFTKVSGKLPKGVELRPNGEIYGAPTESGTFTFRVKMTNSESSFDECLATFTLEVGENTDANLAAATDEGYSIQTRVPDFTACTDQEFKIEGDLSEFIDLWLDGKRLEEGVDYSAESGSTKTTIFSQTFSKAGTGTHTIAAEFRVDGDVNKELKTAAQNYRRTPSGSSSRNPSRDPDRGVTTTPAGTAPSDTTVDGQQTGAAAKRPFIDVTENDWFYNDVSWAHENDLLKGVGDDRYDPGQEVSQAMVTTLLARIKGVELDKYSDVSGTTVAADQWYTNASVWAWQAGMIPGSGFSAEPPFCRGDMAVMLVKYLDYLGVKYKKPTVDVVFADSDEMTAEQNEAFQVLYHNGIFKGVGGNAMAPNAAASRAEIAALAHRLTEYLTGK